MSRFSSVLLTGALLFTALPAFGYQLDDERWASFFDLFGSDQVTLKQIGKDLAPEIDAYYSLLEAGDRVGAEVLEDQIEAAIHQMGDFALVELTEIFYFGATGQRVFVTIDLVDTEDAAERLAFLPPPTAQVTEVDDLLDAWVEYEDLSFFLVLSGEISFPIQCDVFHCLFGFDHPLLESFELLFDAEVPAEQAALTRVLYQDADPRDRASAAFLLAHLDDGETLVDTLLPAIPDSDGLVRNNVMRVLSSTAANHPSVDVPLGPIVDSLVFPLASDRNKTLAVLASLSLRPDLRDDLILQVGEQVLDLLYLKQPNNQGFAHIILLRLSGETFGDTDFKAWEKWLKAALKELRR